MEPWVGAAKSGKHVLPNVPNRRLCQGEVRKEQAAEYLTESAAVACEYS